MFYEVLDMGMNSRKRSGGPHKYIRVAQGIHMDRNSFKSYTDEVRA